MFEDLKADLATIEAKLQATFGDVNGQIGALEGDIASIDQSLMASLDRVEASIEGEKSAVLGAFQLVHNRLNELVPPG